ncbi:MAG: hypothetical protein CBB97_25290 [Candidatus Endolissoclinum sp. TMED37]|nr:MAG: hypothetical protein CBB97_25290 [Candidatus Endolissoclinum sp. TMED37]|tara:strand:- start:1559 stop:2572 length:1014 start_codon:yes stop_codon:yes gene_type:complete
MAQTVINVGSNANDGTGDDLRSAMISINANFTELYAASPVTSQITIDGNEISTAQSNANLKLTASGTGVVELEGIQIRDNHIEATRTNDDLILSASGTGNIIAGAIRISGSTISSDDSTGIKINDELRVTTIASDDSTAVLINDSLNVAGTLTVDTIDTNTIGSNDSTAIQITDALNVSGTLSADTIDTNTISSTDSSAVTISDNLQVNGTLSATAITGLSVLNHSAQSDGTVTVATSTTSVVDSFSSTATRSAKYLISISDATNSRFEIVECLVTHGPSADSTTEAFLTVFGSTSNHTGPLATFTVDINNGNVRLLTTNTSSDAAIFKFVRTAINV